MKISNDQNRIELDDGTVLIGIPSEEWECTGCHFNYEGSPCHPWTKDIPCLSSERKDDTSKIFIKEQPNA
ncbi:MAG: hypothetical protein ACRCXB_08825 [Aeromonadaceae bacterium]